MQVSARADYALRACVVLAAAGDLPLSAEVVAMKADLPGKFVEAILTKLRQARIVTTQRGPGGGCRLCEGGGVRRGGAGNSRGGLHCGGLGGWSKAGPLPGPALAGGWPAAADSGTPGEFSDGVRPVQP